MTKEERKLYNNQYRLKNRDKLCQQKLDWYYANRDHALQTSVKANRLRFYGLTHEAYLQLLEDQNHVCAICYRPERAKNPSGSTKPLAVDHDHTTGRVRGLLCSTCNTALGKLNDDVKILESCISYLNRSRSW